MAKKKAAPKKKVEVPEPVEEPSLPPGRRLESNVGGHNEVGGLAPRWMIGKGVSAV